MMLAGIIELQGERRLAASMILLCWAWPLVVIPFILYGILILLRAALGRE